MTTKTTTEYTYRTDSELGTISAVDFDDACEQVAAMLTSATVADGAWAWVQDTDGDRVEYGWAVQVRTTTGGWTDHSHHVSRDDAQDQADMVGGRLVSMRS